jgi:glycosyltransferase involved in cell wall biosynthesis
MPKISVVIPTYNRSTYVTKAIDSVLAQSYRDYEIIVVDDGSTDNTCEVLKSYMNKICYIYQENAGVSATRNRGVRESKGLYLAFLDSDDLWYPEKLELQVKHIQDNDAENVISFHGVEWFVQKLEEKELLRRCESVKWPRVSTDGYVKDPVLDVAEGAYFSLGTMLCCKSTFLKIGFFCEELSAGEDEEWISRAAMRLRFRYLPQPYLKILYHKAKTNLSSERSVRSLIKVFERIRTRTKGVNQSAYKAITRRLANKISELSNIAARDNRRLESSCLALRAFLLDPKQYLRLFKITMFLVGWKPDKGHVC